MEEAEGEPIKVWPENAPAVNLLIAMGTQWRIGFSGPTGLDYGVLPELWRRLRVPPAQRDDVFADLRMLEDAALSQMRRNKGE